MILSEEFYHGHHENYELVLFDMRGSSALFSLGEQSRGWGKSASIETIDENHSVLVVRTGGALRGQHESHR